MVEFLRVDMKLLYYFFKFYDCFIYLNQIS